MAEWNTVAATCGIKKCLTINGKRRTALRARLKEPWWRDNWRDALKQLPGIDYVNKGFKDNPDFRGNVDWFLQPTRVAVILERVAGSAEAAPSPYAHIGKHVGGPTDVPSPG